jgi:ADP-heptose:LPS heptosyltransferase
LTFNPQNILVIDFGQLGDVVLSLPALQAIRGKFPDARITVAVGKSCATVIDLARVADEKIVVDRVELRDGARLKSVLTIAKLVGDVRRRNFDLVIDLHSLAETNVLGFLSGAGKRLYASRENRSLDFLSSFRAPREDKSKHATDRYLDVLKPLRIESADRIARLEPRAEDAKFVEKLWQKLRLEDGLTVGLFPGAGHVSRQWKLENFAALAEFLARNDNLKIAVFLGPEEKNWTARVREIFPAQTVVFDNLTLPQLVAALGRLSVFVSNDTGPMHLAAAAGTSVVVVLDQSAPLQYMPLIGNLRVVQRGKIGELDVESVYAATRELFSASRVSHLMER